MEVSPFCQMAHDKFEIAHIVIVPIAPDQAHGKADASQENSGDGGRESNHQIAGKRGDIPVASPLRPDQAG